MNESIKIELKEICMQIMNLLGQRNYGHFPHAQTKLISFIEGRVDAEIPYQFKTVSEGYETWILRLLIDLQQWRGNDARVCKALLKVYLEYFQGKKDTGNLRESVNPMWQAIRGIGD